MPALRPNHHHRPVAGFRPLRVRFGTPLLLVIAHALLAFSAQAASKIDFNKQIRPILSDNCYACHGPDDHGRKGGLRLDTPDGAFVPAKSGDPAILPGNPAGSELIKRIVTQDEEDVMPPRKTGKTLTPDQIALLKQWISEGAPVTSHWAFRKPVQPPLPEVKTQGWTRNEIDRFILARLEKEGLFPAAEADRATLLRRVALDLTGLPPTPQEVDLFLKDRSSNAYEKAVDRLLNSPRFGEHMARYWLDAVRYADTHGYHIDSTRAIWKYREWVINAFNANMPYDQFSVEQLAGDLLPEPTLDQKVASGFVRCNMSSGEGGAIVEEYQAKYAFDRVETAGTVWLGLTLVCARCHTHKYDPIPQKEYYGLYNFFNNVEEEIMDGNKPNPEPFLKIPSAAQSRRLEQLRAQIKSGQESFDRADPALDKSQTDWMNRLHQDLKGAWTLLTPEKAISTSTNGARLALLEDGSVSTAAPIPEKDVHEITFKVAPGKFGAFRLEALPDPAATTPVLGRSDAGKFRLSEVELDLLEPPKETKVAEEKTEGAETSPKKPEESWKRLKLAAAISDSAEEKSEADKAIDGKPETGWSASNKDAAGPKVLALMLADPLTVETNTLLRARLRYEATKDRELLARVRLAGIREPAVIDRLFPAKPTPWQVIGPFVSGTDLGAALAKAYPPESEKEIDLKKAHPGVREEIRWNARGEFADGQANTLVSDLHGVHGVYFLTRKLTLSAPVETTLSFRADDLFKVWVNDQLVLERRVPETAGDDHLTARVKLKAGDNKFLIKIVNYQGASTFSFGREWLPIDPIPGSVVAALAATPAPVGPERTNARTYHRRSESPAARTTYAALQRYRDQERHVDQAIPTTLIAKESSKMKDTYLLVRGEYDKKGEKVPPAVISILAPWPKGAQTNRLGLAQWLVSGENPLTARVTVNRFWQQFFGIGIVKTTEDFGVQGDNPSHPELLEWLATDFVGHGWNVKRLARMFVTSATYRQQSKATKELIQSDPENRLLARGPRYRLDGETIRDLALSVSGLLVERPGGRSVKPYEPGGLWEAVSYNNSQKYVVEKGEAQYRRSVYTHWKRQSPPPSMLIFDASTREFCTVRRPRTNTPLQALVLLNDPQFVEASRALAQRMIREGGRSPQSRLALGFRLATSRTASPEELRVLLEAYQAHSAEFNKNRTAATEFLDVGQFRQDARIPAEELAAWTAVASMLLNLDETMTKG